MLEAPAAFPAAAPPSSVGGLSGVSGISGGGGEADFIRDRERRRDGARDGARDGEAVYQMSGGLGRRE